jgi:hypothetical protein
MHFLFVFRIVEDDHLAVARRPYDVTIEFTKNLLGQLKVRVTSAIKFSSSEDEDKSISVMFLEVPPYSNTSERGQHEETSEGDLGGGVETQTAPAVEFQCRWVEDFPRPRESASAWYPSCPPLLAS